MRNKAVLWGFLGLLSGVVACGTLSGRAGTDAATGTVVGPENCHLVVSAGQRPLDLDLSRGEAALAAGEFRLVGISLYASDREGIRWMLPGQRFPEDALLSVKPGQKTRVNAGPPLTVSIDARPLDGGHCIDFGSVIAGCGGETYSAPMPRRGSRSGGFRLTDDNGTTVATGAFEYG